MLQTHKILLLVYANGACCYLVVCVAAEVGGSKLQDTPSRGDVDRVAMLGCISLSYGIHTHLIWRKVQFLNYIHLYTQV